MGGDWIARDAAHVWHGFTQMSTYADNAPVIVERAEGHEVIDVDGRRYLDAISSLWVNTLGHQVPELDDALRDQLDRGAHSTMLGNGNRVVIELAEALARVVPVEDAHFLFASDGASAVEQALKIAFQFWVNQGVPGHTRFLAFGDAYHGDTIGALSVGDGGFGTDLFDALRFPVLRAPSFSDPRCFDIAIDMVAAHAPELAAVIIEPLVQGAAGMQLADRDGLEALGRACRDHDVLLIADEVATGFGRTGTLFASEQCGLRPDLLVLGKGLTGGYLPMSATAASGRVFDAFLGADLGERTLYHGHSYSGNALAATVALRHLELLDAWSVLENVRARSDELRGLLDDRIASHPAVAEVRLCGLMGGVELAPDGNDLRWGRRVCAAAVERGVLLRPLGDVVVLMPPLTITSPELHRIVNTLADALDADRAVMTWQDWADHEAKRVRDAEQWRRPRDLDLDAGADGPTGVVDDHNVVSFASNDYLGLTRHPAVVAAAHDALDRWGTGSGSARLIVGSRPVHTELEAALADWKGTERAVLFTTGFAANLGVITTFAGPDVLVCSDELNHASIIDGRRLAGAPLAVYRHCDAAHVDQILGSSDLPRALVVSETVFSMDGDLAPAAELADVCARHGALLVLDEAHAVLQPDAGLPDAGRPHDGDVLRVGTLSKTLGALGGFVAGPARFTDLVVNRARSYIFTTASTPADTAAALAALAVLRSSEGDELRARLRANVDRLRLHHPSPIVPYVCGSEHHALEVAAALLDDGLLVTAIRPPTVPPGTSRLRVTMSAAHTAEQVDRLSRALASHFPLVTRPRMLVFVAGTSTEVGKTWWTAAVARELRADGVTVAARKPVQSAAPGEPLDADLLAAATGVDPDTVCPPHRTYTIPWAPPMAADELGLAPFTVADLVGELVWPDGVAVGLVEGVGGPRSPIAADGDNVDFASALRPDLVVLVGDAGLGTINAVRLSAEAFDGVPVVVALNRYGDDPLHVRNRDFLVDDIGFDVVTEPSQLAARLA